MISFSPFSLLIAYLDPGSGSLFIQLVISAIIGIGFFLRSKFGKLKNLFRKKTDETDLADMEEDDIDVE